MESSRGIIVLHEKDNVATTIFDLPPSNPIKLPKLPPLTLQDFIPAGHKFALIDLPPNARIIKYGHTIGISTHAIRAGQHIHVHNVASLRGRKINDK